MCAEDASADAASHAVDDAARHLLLVFVVALVDPIDAHEVDVGEGRRPARGLQLRLEDLRVRPVAVQAEDAQLGL